MKDKTWI